MPIRSEARLQQSLDDVTRLLDKHRVLETLAHRQEGPKRDLLEGLQHRQNLAELGKRVRVMHGADLAFVLEALPTDDRRLVWEQATPEQAGRAFVEVTGVVREWLVEATPHDTLVQLLLTLDPEDLGYVSESIPPRSCPTSRASSSPRIGKPLKSRSNTTRSRSAIIWPASG